MRKSLKRNFYAVTREWPYKNVRRRIIAEQLLEAGDGEELADYKFFCFHGVPKVMLMAHGRFTTEGVKFDYYDIEGNLLPFEQGGPSSGVSRPMPSCFGEMVKIAEKLSYAFPHVRVDLYQVKGKIYFGEMTFYDSSGMDKFSPDEWDEKFGSWLDLSMING